MKLLPLKIIGLCTAIAWVSIMVFIFWIGIIPYNYVMIGEPNKLIAYSEFIFGIISLIILVVYTVKEVIDLDKINGVDLNKRNRKCNIGLSV